MREIETEENHIPLNNESYITRVIERGTKLNLLHSTDVFLRGEFEYKPQYWREPPANHQVIQICLITSSIYN